MNHSQFQDIVHRYFRGQLEGNEYDLLFDCLQEPANQEYFDRAKLDWENNPELDELGNKNLSRLRYKIGQISSNDTKNRVVRQLWSRVAAAAAILIFGIFAGGSLSYFASKGIGTEQLVFETPRGEKSMVKLPDGSEVWLNANSRLIYNSFSATHRQVELKGEAFFKVKHNERAPFIVRTNECDVKVLGTTFNVMAYDEFGRKEITLLSGKVNVLAEGTEHILAPGQSLVLKNHSMQIKKVDSSEASAWVENKFNFHNIPLSELMKRLENWYDVDITLENPSGKEENFTGTFKNEETIWQVLDAIQANTPIQYKKSDLRQIEIKVE